MLLRKLIFRSCCKQRCSYKFQQIYWIIESILYSPDGYGCTKCELEVLLTHSIRQRSCNVHVVKCGFKIGTESTNWKLKKILKACFTIFHNIPARRDKCDWFNNISLVLLCYKVCLFDFMNDICHMHDIVWYWRVVE